MQYLAILGSSGMQYLAVLGSSGMQYLATCEERSLLRRWGLCFFSPKNLYPRIRLHGAMAQKPVIAH
jgi:hypothetical protein